MHSWFDSRHVSVCASTCGTIGNLREPERKLQDNESEMCATRARKQSNAQKDNENSKRYESRTFSNECSWCFSCFLLFGMHCAYALRFALFARCARALCTQTEQENTTLNNREPAGTKTKLVFIQWVERMPNFYRNESGQRKQKRTRTTPDSITWVGKHAKCLQKQKRKTNAKANEN